MKRLSLQWRITLMSVLLIGITCVTMNLLLCSSGVYYMDTIADSLQGGGTVILNDGGAASFDPQLIAPNEEYYYFKEHEPNSLPKLYLLYALMGAPGAGLERLMF